MHANGKTNGRHRKNMIRAGRERSEVSSRLLFSAKRIVPLRAGERERGGLTILDRKTRREPFFEQDEKVDYIYHKVYEIFLFERLRLNLDDDLCFPLPWSLSVCLSDTGLCEEDDNRRAVCLS